MTRAEGLVDGQPENVAHGWLRVLYLAKSLFVEADFASAIHLADEAIEMAARLNTPGLRALAMSFKGICLIETGQWKAGMALIDESVVVALSEQGDARAASDVYCNTIAACRNLGDYQRAGEWTKEAERWMTTNALGGYTGVCQVHRAELKRLRGSWSDAEDEARQACVELERFHITDALGFAHYEIGEVRRQMGDLEAAEEAFNSAYQYGHRALPGRALLMHDRGQHQEAASTINRALDKRSRSEEDPVAVPSRGRLLPAQVELSLAVGDLATARKAADELSVIASNLEGTAWKGWALACGGATALAEGRPEDAIESLGEAWRLWLGIDLPYEGAKTRTMLGQAYLAAGDKAAARLELQSARSMFEELGAVRDVELLDRLETGMRHGPRVTKVFMFTDIVTSTDLVGVIGDERWQDLLEWHDRALREQIADSGGQEVRHTGDGFFATFDDARAGIECAVSIQRRLSEHRRASGFAPDVRIGLHVAEATQRGNDYAGQGVHAAARVGAVATGEEIVISADVEEAAGTIGYDLTGRETLSLKGIAEPVEVMRVEWR